MDRKAIIVLALSFLLLVAWVPLVNWLYPPKPLPPGATAASQITNRVNLTSPPPVTALAAAPTNEPPKPLLRSQEPEVLEKVVTEWATYVFTSHGGGLKEVELSAKLYPENIVKNTLLEGSQRGVVLNRGAMTPVLALGGHSSLEDDGVYKLIKIEGGLRAEKTLANGLRVVKEFRPMSNYLMSATVRLENSTKQSIMVPSQHWKAGTASLINAKDDPLQVGVFVYDGKRATHIDNAWFDNRTLGCIPGTPRDLFESTSDPALWAAVHNRFFTLATIPTEPAPKATAQKAELDLAEKNPALRKGIEVSLTYPSKILEPTAGQNAIERKFTIYAGPKEYNGLARIGDQMKNNLDYIMKFNGFFGFFSKVLLLSMNWLHDSLKLPYGWAIIFITVLIKIIFWPLTQASTKSMKRMSTLQPEMNKIREKYKDDPQKMNKKIMEFMKENKVSPLGGCLPMLIQIPVFFGFYYMIQSAIELRGASFLWAWDLSVPDTIAILSGFPINPLPIVMGVTMFWQASLTPPSPGMDPAQQKMMKYMPLIFLFVLYNMSSGLTLYWTVQNILTIVQTKLTKTGDKTTGNAVVASTPHKKR